MADNKQMEMEQSQSQNQQQNQNQQSQQMIITAHEIQQNVQQQNQQQQQNQAQQQNQQQANGPQKLQAQVAVQPQVAAIMPQQHDAVAVSMQQQQQAQQQAASVGGVSMTLSGQQGATTITTMAAHPQAVQVIQQPMQNQYQLQHLYNAQGTPLIMPSNMLAHPAGISPSPIQVQFNNIAGKPLQAGAQYPHLLTTASTGQGGTHPGAGGTKVQGFPAGGYIPVPTSATPGGQPTLVFSQLEVVPQHQPSIQQQGQQQGNNKNDQVQKYTTCATGTPSGQNRSMQFAAPWQFAPQGMWTGLQPQTILTAAPNQIFIRGDPTQPDMFIQSSQPIQTHNALAAQQQIQGVQQIATTGGKPRVMSIQQQQQPQGKPGVVSQRPLSILPSLQGVQGANIRPASSVSTQTNHGVQTTVNSPVGKTNPGPGKGRGKPIVRTSPGPNSFNVTVTKAGGGGATTTTSNSSATGVTTAKTQQQQHSLLIQSQQVPATSAANGNTTNGKVVTSQAQQPPGSPMSDKQNFNIQQQQANKQAAMQSSQQQAQVQAQLQAQQVQQQQIQQIFIQQIHAQQQQHLQQYQQAQAQPQQIQPKPIMSMVQQGQQQPNVMPVVSINPALIGNQLAAHPALQALPTIVSQSDQLAAVQQMQLQAAAAAAQQVGEQAATGAGAAPSMPVLVTSPERGGQIELQPMMPPPPPPATPLNSIDEMKVASNLKKDSIEESMDIVNNNDTDMKNSTKDDNQELNKMEEKSSTDHLMKIVNTVNSITNGNIGEETTVLESLPTQISGKQVPPKAMVKPQVLTHVIEGFVIQEASEPFAVNRTSLNGSITQETNSMGKHNSADKENQEEPPNKKKKLPVNYVDGEQGNKMDINVLEDQNTKNKKDKKLTSSVSPKTKKKDMQDGNIKQWSDMEIDVRNDNDLIKKNGEELTNSISADDSIPKINPVKWTVGEVCEFIRNMPGCEDYAEDFAIQEIDGQALMLLKEDHLMSAMSIKLGPALKIVAKINSMKDPSSASSPPVSSVSN